MSLPTKEIFRLVQTYRDGFTVHLEGRKKVFVPNKDKRSHIASSQAAEILLREFEPLLQEYARFLRTGIPSENTRKLARCIRGELVKLTLQYMDDEDLIAELRVCLLSFCQKWDGIIQHFDWEVSNWVNRVTRDPSCWLPPLSKGTTFYEPYSIELCMIPEEDFSTNLVDDLSSASLMCLIYGILPEPGKWSSLFTEEECRWIHTLFTNTTSDSYSENYTDKMVSSVSSKVRYYLEHQNGSIEYTVTKIY